MIAIELKDKLKEQIEEIHWEWFLARSKKKFPATKNNGMSYYDYILSKIDLIESGEISGMSPDEIEKLKKKRLKDLIVGDPNKNEDKNREEIKHFDFFIQLNHGKNWSDQDIKYIKKAFGYDDFRMSPDLKNWAKWFNSVTKKWYTPFLNTHGIYWNIKTLCSRLKIDVCPYCNRQYIFSYNKNSYEKNSAEIDHFYAQSLYPYLSCSLYNFIPSCPTCNFLKGDEDDEILYPYTESYENKSNHDSPHAYFVFERKDGARINSYEDVINCDKKIFVEIDQAFPQSSKIDNEKKLFCIDELYNCHTVALEDIINRFEMYPHGKEVEMQRLFKKSEEEIKNVIYGFSLNQVKKEYPLRKFREDIVRFLMKLPKNR